MTIPVHIPDELAREATRRGLDVAAYIEQMPATLDAITALWATRRPPTYSAERISVGKYFNLTRGLPDDARLK